MSACTSNSLHLSLPLFLPWSCSLLEWRFCSTGLFFSYFSSLLTCCLCFSLPPPCLQFCFAVCSLCSPDMITLIASFKLVRYRLPIAFSFFTGFIQSLSPRSVCMCIFSFYGLHYFFTIRYQALVNPFDPFL